MPNILPSGGCRLGVFIYSPLYQTIEVPIFSLPVGLQQLVLVFIIMRNDDHTFFPRIHYFGCFGNSFYSLFTTCNTIKFNSQRLFFIFSQLHLQC